MTEFLQEFGMPLKVIAWGYIIVQGVALCLVIPAFIIIARRVWKDMR